MLGLRELRRACAAIERELVGARLERLVEPAQGDRVFLVLATPRAGAPRRRTLLLCARPGFGRVSALPGPPKAPPTPPPFAQLLRARLERARLAGARLLDEDRELALRFEGRGGSFELLLQLLGSRSNLYLLDAEGRLVGAQRALEGTRPDLSGGAPWRAPATPRPREGEDRFADVADGELLSAVEAHYAAAEAGQARAELEREIVRGLGRERAALARKEAHLRSDLAAARPAEAERRTGEQLRQALHEVQPGAAFVETTDWETGERVRIELDPALGPAANLERIFARYRKAKRRDAALAAELERLTARRAELEALEGELDSIRRGSVSETTAGLERLAARPALRALLGRRRAQPVRASGPRAAHAPSLPARLRPRRYRSADGLELWVGRSDEGNDHLTTRLAAPGDLFFHVDAAPGSHVVLRLAGRREAPPESVLDGCELAAHFSKARGSGAVEVRVAPLRDVRKPAGARPGLVQVRGGRAIRLRREPGRLARLLAGRLPDGALS